MHSHTVHLADPRLGQVRACQGSTCWVRADRTLAAAQQATDFKPLEDFPAEAGLPTLACTLVSALLSGLFRTASAHLQGANAESFNTEVGFHAHSCSVASAWLVLLSCPINFMAWLLVR